ncbi:hypothetical protein HAX54_006269 [Datura stramonium]|uniref:Uncharacterized protein n=1 Tax=Datura stramonium TaxID=4076 RepID=A0ABS8WYJ7_DATST|nr:hypothetical protein [Datura stramonium]
MALVSDDNSDQVIITKCLVAVIRDRGVYGSSFGKKKKGFEEQRVVEEGDLSANFCLAVIGALLKLWISVSSVIFDLCMHKSCCDHQQGISLFFPTVSMRLRPKGLVLGVVCFGGFHINRFLSDFAL